MYTWRNSPVNGMEAIALLGKGVLVAGSQAAHASPADMSDQQRAHAHLVDLCTHPEGERCSNVLAVDAMVGGDVHVHVARLCLY